MIVCFESLSSTIYQSAAFFTSTWKYHKLVGPRVKANTTWTTKNTTSPHYFSKKFKTNTLQGHKRWMKIFGLEINNLLVQNFGGKNDVISFKNSAFRELQVLIKLIFRYNFQFSIFILQESSKRCLIFSYFSAVFEKWANLSRQELLFNHILKEC